MTTIESHPDIVAGDLVIGPWRHYEFQMRGELFRSASASVPAVVYVWLVHPESGRKWPVCKARAAHTISDVVFTQPFVRDEGSAQIWGPTAPRRLVEHSPGLWRRTVVAQLVGAYMRAACTACEEVSC